MSECRLSRAIARLVITFEFGSMTLGTVCEAPASSACVLLMLWTFHPEREKSMKMRRIADGVFDGIEYAFEERQGIDFARDERG